MRSGVDARQRSPQGPTIWRNMLPSMCYSSISAIWIEERRTRSVAGKISKERSDGVFRQQ
jgi:hypothetical protein